MAHAPGVGYSAQRAAKAKAVPASIAAPADSAPAAAAAATTSPAPPSISLPGPSDIPGANAGEKALLVVGILVIGLGVFSRITGKPISLGLTGFTGSAPAGQPAATIASLPLTQTMASRTAAAVPAKVGA